MTLDVVVYILFLIYLQELYLTPNVSTTQK